MADAPKRRSRAAGTGKTESVRARKPKSAAARDPWTPRDVAMVVSLVAILMVVTIAEMKGGVLVPPRSPLAAFLVASGPWVGLFASAWLVHRSSWFRFRREMVARHGKRARDPFLPVLAGLLVVAGSAAGWYVSHRLGPQWVTRLWGREGIRPALLLDMPEIPTRRNCKRPAIVAFPDVPEAFETCFLTESQRAEIAPGDTLLLAVRESSVGIQVDRVLGVHPAP